MQKLNKQQIKSLIPQYKCHIAQELEYAHRGEAPFGPVEISVYADNAAKPDTMLFINGFAGTALYGDASNNERNQKIRELILDCFDEDGKEVWLSLYSPGWEAAIDAMFENDCTSWKAYRLIHRLNKAAFQEHMNWREKIPEGYTLERFDTSSHDFIAKRDWRDFWHPGSGRFGWFLLKDGQVVSECTAVWVEKYGVETGCVEIGIETKEPYRKKGYAVLTASAFIDDCLSRNLVPVWCCWDFREGSKELAGKLGFEIVEERRAVFLKKNLPSCKI